MTNGATGTIRTMVEIAVEIRAQASPTNRDTRKVSRMVSVLRKTIDTIDATTTSTTSAFRTTAIETAGATTESFDEPTRKAIDAASAKRITAFAGMTIDATATAGTRAGAALSHFV